MSFVKISKESMSTQVYLVVVQPIDLDSKHISQTADFFECIYILCHFYHIVVQIHRDIKREILPKLKKEQNITKTDMSWSTIYNQIRFCYFRYSLSHQCVLEPCTHHLFQVYL